jgi:hypothetical protein
MLRDETHDILYLHPELSQTKVPNTRGKLPWLPKVRVSGVRDEWEWITTSPHVRCQWLLRFSTQKRELVMLEGGGLSPEARGLRPISTLFAYCQTPQCIPVLCVQAPTYLCRPRPNSISRRSCRCLLEFVPLLLQALNSLVYPFVSDSFSIGTSLRGHWNARIYLEHFNGSCLRCPCSPCFNFSLRFPVLCATRRCLILKSRPLIPDTGLKPLNRRG